MFLPFFCDCFCVLCFFVVCFCFGRCYFFILLLVCLYLWCFIFLLWCLFFVAFLNMFWAFVLVMVGMCCWWLFVRCLLVFFVVSVCESESGEKC